MEQMKIKLQLALEECERLKQENLHLKKLLNKYNIPFPDEASVKHYEIEREIDKRISIFNNLFKGREDVFAIQWQKEEGKVGYSPAVKGKSYIPLINQVIYNHLNGKETIGIYPLLKDNTCWFLAVDFDKKAWKEDASVCLNVCKELNVPASMEISRSGNGCHIWIFFDVPISAADARKLGNMVLTRTLENGYQAGISSFDRLFPSQDTLPEGGFGNLIALPLQKGPRKNSNSVFVDEHFRPYPNQWEYLASVRKMSKAEVENLVKDIRHEEKISEINQPLPHKLEVILKNGIYIQKDGLPREFANKLIQLATFSNPAFYKAQSRRLSTYKIPRTLKCADIFEDYFILPRGCIDGLEELCAENNIELVINDSTNHGTELEVKFLGELTAQQEDAAEQLRNRRHGILSATTGFGKTVIAATLISKRKVNTLVIVHTKQLLEQWKEKLCQFLDIDPGKIGQIGGGKNTAKGFIDIATIQSLNYEGEIKDAVRNYGQIIVDECHHISAFRFEAVLKKAEAEFICGLTATPKRKDGLHPIMTMQCGPIRYKVTAKAQAKVLPFKRVLIPRKTAFKSNLFDKESTLQNLYSSIIQDKKRNEMIFNDVLLELEKGSTPLILTERIEHVEILENMFRGFAKNMLVLTGGLKRKKREDRLKKLQEIPANEEKLIIATGKYIGEGFDYAVLDTLFLTMPIAWKGTLEQYVGRLHRLYENKETLKVYDYIDAREETFRKMFMKRNSAYKSLGYKVDNKEFSEQMKLFL
ncbi:TOTE conflict system archaeo-eukaryotic primase domain-containing protein [Oceanobacillus bengalensis]|uniref:DEAD/DEAH box helicase n=1 Tax=Oceanobacillus bengalensis TaxID=1435466 RepID=A0A494Z6M7_9BACI|nr:DEAD/DEAH box helicase [Oceanobacillus bengalensis]RKQ18174.1 DEAD/DEAH box helicase [Oceanobacillus bengalensis]